MQLIRKIKHFDGQKKWLTEWEKREMKKSDDERKKEQELYYANINTNWTYAKNLITNGVNFDFVSITGYGPIYWLLHEAYSGNIHDRASAKQLWYEIENETRNEEVHKSWLTLLVMEKYECAAQIINWSRLRASLPEETEQIKNVASGLVNFVSGRVKMKKYNFTEYHILSTMLSKLDDPMHFLLWLFIQNNWGRVVRNCRPRKITESILKDISEKDIGQKSIGIERFLKNTTTGDISKLSTLLANLSNPIYHLMFLMKDEHWPDKLTNQVLVRIGQNKNRILQDDLKYIDANDLIKTISGGLTNFIIYDQKLKLLDIVKLLSRFDHPIYTILVLSKENNWKEGLTKLVLDQLAPDTRDILEKDLKFITDRGYLASVEIQLANFVPTAKAYELFENKYFNSEPLTWNYKFGRKNFKFVAEFLKEYFTSVNQNYADLVAEIANGDVKVR